MVIHSSNYMRPRSSYARKQKIYEGDLLWQDFINYLEVKKSNDPFVPSREYECPAHIFQIIQDHDLLRESQTSLLRNSGSSPDDKPLWKFNVLLRSCLAAERRDMGDINLTKGERLQFPRPLYSEGAETCFGFKHLKGPRFFDQSVETAVFFDDEEWCIGLTVHRAWSGSRVPREMRKCLVQMKVVYLRREKMEYEQNFDIFGVVTSGDVIQFHKLKSGKEVQSSPVFLLTSEGLPAIWSYLRDIIHTVQLRAPHPPSGSDAELNCFNIPEFVRDRIFLTHKLGCTPAGTPIRWPEPTDEESRQRAEIVAEYEESIARRLGCVESAESDKYYESPSSDSGPEQELGSDGCGNPPGGSGPTEKLNSGGPERPSSVWNPEEYVKLVSDEYEFPDSGSSSTEENEYESDASSFDLCDVMSGY